MLLLALALAVAAFGWSFVLAVAILQIKHWRNARLLAHGGVPIKDCVFPKPVWFLCTFLGVAGCAIAAAFGAATLVVVASALGPPLALALVPIVATVLQARA